MQPVDVSIAKSLKASIKSSFQEHVIDNFLEIVKPDRRRKKTFKTPHKAEIISWILIALEKLNSKTILSGFIEAGICGQEKENSRRKVLDKKIRKFYIDTEFNNENLLAYPNDPSKAEIHQLLQALEQS